MDNNDTLDRTIRSLQLHPKSLRHPRAKSRQSRYNPSRKWHPKELPRPPPPKQKKKHTDPLNLTVNALNSNAKRQDYLTAAITGAFNIVRRRSVDSVWSINLIRESGTTKGHPVTARTS